MKHHHKRTKRNSRQKASAKLDPAIPPVPPVIPLTASGCGDPRGNGLLTRDGDWNGYPMYVAAGGGRYYVADMNHYRCDLTGGTMNTDYANPATGTVVGTYTVSMGMAPAGTVTGTP